MSKKVEGLIGKIKDGICPPHPTMGFRSEAEQTGTEEKLSFGRNSQHWFLHWNESIAIEVGLCLKVTGEFLVTMNNQKSHVNKNPRDGRETAD